MDNQKNSYGLQNTNDSLSCKNLIFTSNRLIYYISSALRKKTWTINVKIEIIILGKWCTLCKFEMYVCIIEKAFVLLSVLAEQKLLFSLY